MKIGEIKEGTKYGALDHPRHHWGLPREVTAVEIVTEEQKQYSNDWTGVTKTVNRRRVKIRFEDEPTGQSSWRELIGTKEKGSTMVIDAKHLVGEWKDLRQGVKEKVEKERKKNELQASLEARLHPLLGEDCESSIYVSDGRRGASLNVYGEEVERILYLAELGLETISEPS